MFLRGANHFQRYDGIIINDFWSQSLAFEKENTGTYRCWSIMEKSVSPLPSVDNDLLLFFIIKNES